MHFALLIGALLLPNSHMKIVKQTLNVSRKICTGIASSIEIPRELRVGPLEIRRFSSERWSYLEALIVRNRHGGKMRREDGLRAGFKSDFVIETYGIKDPDDVLVDPDTGAKTYGLMITQGEEVYKISASEVAAKNLGERLQKEARQEANQAALRLDPEVAAQLVPA